LIENYEKDIYTPSMSREVDEVKTVCKVVVVFDICSSTTLLEDLIQTENLQRWRNVLIGLKEFLVVERSNTSFEIYKFIGDGWVLLFDANSITGTDLMQFLRRLCLEYKKLFKKHIYEVLSTKICDIGLKFGIELGTLLKIVMNRKREYIGRPLNVAARLQDAIKQRDAAPHGKLLISKNAFSNLGLSKSPKYAGKLVGRALRNISGGERYQARKIVILK